MSNIQFGKIYKFNNRVSEGERRSLPKALEDAIPEDQGIPSVRFQPPTDALGLNIVLSGKDALHFICDEAEAKKADHDETYKGAYSGWTDGAVRQNRHDYASKTVDADLNPVIVFETAEQARKIINTLA